jgi:hypothetical protein
MTLESDGEDEPAAAEAEQKHPSLLTVDEELDRWFDSAPEAKDLKWFSMHSCLYLV